MHVLSGLALITSYRLYLFQCPTSKQKVERYFGTPPHPTLGIYQCCKISYKFLNMRDEPCKSIAFTDKWLTSYIYKHKNSKRHMFSYSISLFYIGQLPTYFSLPHNFTCSCLNGICIWHLGVYPCVNLVID